MYYLRKSRADEVEQLMIIFDAAKAHLKSLGIDQWQQGYPNSDGLLEDIRKGEGYVLIYENEIAAVGAISGGTDPDYTNIDGQWLPQSNHEKYVVVHRTVVADKFRGRNLSTILFSGLITLAVEKGYKDIRADTHPANKTMQHILNKLGFAHRGFITQQTSQKVLPAYQFIVA
ncbi:LAMI_0A08724g1_1 [Lachancea mirantina]|uniref:LAMI_0A08724g1_1 n=1 Tax=Lachancea mirantina TaxID=1230905 RepID=A0A1G4IS51_9SACH|nr:LAMI_0A08724g1_1 [Lachancea mirantina]